MLCSVFIADGTWFSRHVFIYLCASTAPVLASASIDWYHCYSLEWVIYYILICGWSWTDGTVHCHSRKESSPSSRRSSVLLIKWNLSGQVSVCNKQNNTVLHNTEWIKSGVQPDLSTTIIPFKGGAPSDLTTWLQIPRFTSKHHGSVDHNFSAGLQGRAHLNRSMGHRQLPSSVCFILFSHALSFWSVGLSW